MGWRARPWFRLKSYIYNWINESSIPYGVYSYTSPTCLASAKACDREPPKATRVSSVVSHVELRLFLPRISWKHGAVRIQSGESVAWIRSPWRPCTSATKWHRFMGSLCMFHHLTLPLDHWTDWLMYEWPYRWSTPLNFKACTKMASEPILLRWAACFTELRRDGKGLNSVQGIHPSSSSSLRASISTGR